MCTVLYCLCVNVYCTVLFVRKCVLYYCHRVATELQFINISYHNLSLSSSEVAAAKVKTIVLAKRLLTLQNQQAAPITLLLTVHHEDTKTMWEKQKQCSTKYDCKAWSGHIQTVAVKLTVLNWPWWWTRFMCSSSTAGTTPHTPLWKISKSWCVMLNWSFPHPQIIYLSKCSWYTMEGKKSHGNMFCEYRG